CRENRRGDDAPGQGARVPQLRRRRARFHERVTAELPRRSLRRRMEARGRLVQSSPRAMTEALPGLRCVITWSERRNLCSIIGDELRVMVAEEELRRAGDD